MISMWRQVQYDFTRYDVTKWYDKSDWEKRYADSYPQFYVKRIRTGFLRVLMNYQNFSFNAGLEYRPNANFDLKFNYAKVGRTPNIAELFSDGLHHSASVIEIGDMGLKNEQGHQFNLTDSKFNVLKGLNVSVNPYFITKNFIMFRQGSEYDQRSISGVVLSADRCQNVWGRSGC
jgi:iron complex outermembrane receptor protein